MIVPFVNEVIEVRSISRSADGRVCVNVCIPSQNGSELAQFILLEEIFEDLDISKGEAPAELLGDLRFWSSVTAADISACASFADSQSSLRALWLKLVQKKGFDRDVATEAIEILRSRGYVNEGQIAMRRAELCLEKGWGRSRILMQLRSEGFPDFAIELARDFLDKDDHAQRCAALIKKKYGTLPEERPAREKIYASLARMGYSSSDIKAAIKLISEENE